MKTPKCFPKSFLCLFLFSCLVMEVSTCSRKDNLWMWILGTSFLPTVLSTLPYVAILPNQSQYVFVLGTLNYPEINWVHQLTRDFPIKSDFLCMNVEEGNDKLIKRNN